MNLPEEHHDAYWSREKNIEFFSYERNLALPALFGEQELVLDIGCGDGAVGGYLINEKHCEVVGIDFSSIALHRATQKGIKGIKTDINLGLPFADSSFDTVFFGDVIEHMYHPHKAIEEISRVLKPNGRVLISCPNMGYWRYRLIYLMTGMFPATEWIEPDLWNSEHIRFFNKSLINQLLMKYGFKLTTFIGISRRRLDKPFVSVFPSLFGMIMLVEAKKV